jgi:hypothetical protein
MTFKSDMGADMSIPLSFVTTDMLAYVAGPYTAKLPNGEEDHATVAERMRIFSLCIGMLVDLGIKPCSPLYMHMIRGYRTDMPGDWKFWGSYSKVMLKQCHVMIVLKIAGWEESNGVNEEMMFAVDNNIPIIFVDPAELLSAPTLANSNANDGTILVTVSKIESPIKRRLAIAGTFVPILAINTLLVGVGVARSLFSSTTNVFKTAKKHW